MRLSLIWKLTIAFVLVALTVAAIVAFSIRQYNLSQLQRMILDQRQSELQSVLEAYYRSNGSWEGVWRLSQQSLDELPLNLRRRLLPGSAQQGNPIIDRRGAFVLVDANGVVVSPFPPRFQLGDRVPQRQIARGTKLEVDGKVIGTLLTPRQQVELAPEERFFLERVNRALLFATLAALLVALIAGILLSRTLIRPLRLLTEASRKMAKGDLEQLVEVNTRDEVGELAFTFNQMSHDLAEANRLRKQMTADVAHDLRTPLTVISGYIESMRDGVLQASPERLDVIYAEIERLQVIVEDLKVLSQADAGELRLNLQNCAPSEILERSLRLFREKASQNNIALILEVSENMPVVRVDEERMLRVFTNLLSNALRFTPEGGTIRLSAVCTGEQVVMCVEDNGSGIPPDYLPHIFERFYRGDKARQQSGSSESGLGLAISKAIIELHGGRIEVESRIGTGTKFRITLPILEQLRG